MRLYEDGDTYLMPPLFQRAMVRVSGNKTIFDNSVMPNLTKIHFTMSKAVLVKRGTMRRVYVCLQQLKGCDKQLILKGATKQLDNQNRIKKIFQWRTLTDGT